MTYNVGLFCAICLGHGLGHVIFKYVFTPVGAPPTVDSTTAVHLDSQSSSANVIAKPDLVDGSGGRGGCAC